MKTTHQCIPLITLSLLPLLMTGCTVNKVWMVNTRTAGAANVEAGAIRSYSKFTEIKENYRIQGMVCTLVLPLARNEAAAREALARKTAAELGANCVVGLDSLNHPYADAARSRAILVSAGVAAGENQSVRPRFIVGAVPVSLKTDKTNLASRLAIALGPELQYHLAQKGYYTYTSNSGGGDVTGLAADKEIPKGLLEPLGIVPDFILSCEIVDGTYLGLQALQMRVTLYDLQQRRTVWAEVQPVVEWGLLEQLTSPGKKWFNPSESEVAARVHEAVEIAVKKLSPVSGYGKLKK